MEKRLRDWLKNHRVSQELFAKRIGATQGYVSRLLASKRRPGLDVAILIEDFTDGDIPARGWSGANRSSPRPSTSSPH